MVHTAAPRTAYIYVLQDSAAKQLTFSLISRKENDQSTVERQSINSAIASVNLRPLTKKVFKDPVVITLRHSVVSTLVIKWPISKILRRNRSFFKKSRLNTYLKAPLNFTSETFLHLDNMFLLSF